MTLCTEQKTATLQSAAAEEHDGGRRKGTGTTLDNSRGHGPEQNTGNYLNGTCHSKSTCYVIERQINSAVGTGSKKEGKEREGERN
jgi:hypothetical protein